MSSMLLTHTLSKLRETTLSDRIRTSNPGAEGAALRDDRLHFLLLSSPGPGLEPLNMLFGLQLKSLSKISY